ncbi:MAG: SufS family cysteine desulfurase [Lactobacillus sp.]|jgi:cysteine desulfurase/selenocysteine lyase|nr:SufS family cysteine desulfurase [Lactobacillus sp.]
MYDVYKIRKDFPIFNEKINEHDNCFLDTAASAQKPQRVLDKLISVYQSQYANVHRGSYTLSENITAMYEAARHTVQHFLNASTAAEIVFTRNATESINLVAATWGRENLKKGDEVLISEAEHHANMVPWQALSEQLGFTLKYFALNNDGSFSEEAFLKQLSPKTKLVSFTAMSNVLGTVFPVKKIVTHAHEVGALAFVDACQYIVHHHVDVHDWDCDFLAFSGHKTYGPSGIGVLYGKYDLLLQMPPYQYGGDMIRTVSFEESTFDAPPARFEAGTPAIVQAIGLAEAIDYMQEIGLKDIEHHERELTQYAIEKLNSIPGLKMLGTAPGKGGVFSFVLDDVHPDDTSFILNKEGVSVRTGHHCAEPLVTKLGYPSVIRASLGLYSTKEDIDQLVAALLKAKTFF